MHAERPGQPRLRKDAELNRRRIIAAAREVFQKRGTAATLNDVAHHAGVGVGTVYRRFPNKEVLVDALFAVGDNGQHPPALHAVMNTGEDRFSCVVPDPPMVNPPAYSRSWDSTALLDDLWVVRS